MRRDARRTLIAYDIPNDRRRTRIAKELEAYGCRAQYSVFLVDVGAVRIARLIRRLEEHMAPEDSILVCDLGLLEESERRCRVLSGPSVDGRPPSFIV